MKTKKGTVLGPTKIINEYGIEYTYKNSLQKGEQIWIYYDGLGRVKNIEAKRLVVRNKPLVAKKSNTK